MRVPAVLTFCALLIAAAALFLLRGKSPQEDAPGTPSPVAPATAGSPPPRDGGHRETVPNRTNDRAAAEAQVLPGALEIPKAAGSPEEKQQRIEAVQEAATQYSPAGIPLIKPYLLDPDPEVREAAKDSMVNLGEHDGSAALRAAAKQVKDPREAAALLESADFLDLPSADEAGQGPPELSGKTLPTDPAPEPPAPGDKP